MVELEVDHRQRQFGARHYHWPPAEKPATVVDTSAVEHAASSIVDGHGLVDARVEHLDYLLSDLDSMWDGHVPGKEPNEALRNVGLAAAGWAINHDRPA